MVFIKIHIAEVIIKRHRIRNRIRPTGHPRKRTNMSPYNSFPFSRLTCLVVFFAITGALQAQIAPSAPTLLNSNGTTDSGLDIWPETTTDGAGNWVTVWTSHEDLGGTAGTDQDIFVATSSDNGASWTAPALLNSNGTSDAGSDIYPHITTDGSGNWVATWISQEDLGGTAGTDPDVFVATSTDNGASWSAPALLNNNGDTDTGSDVTLDTTTNGTGTWVTTWNSTENLGGTAGGDFDIFVATSLDNGATWSGPTLLNTNGTSDVGTEYSPAIATDKLGNWVTCFRSDEDLGGTAGTDIDIFVATSTDDGASWSAPILLNTNGNTDSGSDFRPVIATDGGGNWVAAWESDEDLGGTAGTDRDVFVTTSTDNGASWSAPALLNTNGASDSGGDINTSLQTDGIGNWVTAWESTDTLGGTVGNDYDILAATSTDNGASWTVPDLVNTNAVSDSGNDIDPNIFTDDAGTWVVVWYSDEDLGGIGTEHDIFATSFTFPGNAMPSATPLGLAVLTMLFSLVCIRATRRIQKNRL